jgi:hypothetical protein
MTDNYIVYADFFDEQYVEYGLSLTDALACFRDYLNELPIGFDDMFIGLYRSDSGYMDGYEISLIQVLGSDLIE